MNLSDTFVEHFNRYQNIELKNTNPELELKLLMDPRISHPNYIKKLDLNHALEKCRELFKYFQKINNGKPINTQTINLIYPPSRDSWDENEHKFNEIKELRFDNGIQNKDAKRYYKKGKNSEPEYIQINDTFNFKATFNLEVDPGKQPICDQKPDKPNYYLIRFKNRFTFGIQYWNIDFTFVKSSTSKSPNVIKSIKDKLFRGVTADNIFTDNIWIWEYADTVEIEFEYKNANKLGKLQMDEIVSVMGGSNDINNQYNTEFMKHLNHLMGNQKYKFTLKSVLPSAIEINKKQYFESVLADIGNFYITYKIDGVRSILIITSDNINLYQSEFRVLSLNKLDDTAILEGEYHEDTFYAYDILEYNGENLTKLDFTQRYGKLKRFEGVWDKLKIKEFTRLTVENYKTEIKKLVEYNKKWNLDSEGYHIDGIIFTSANDSYQMTKFYKWKPHTDITIDFLARRCPKLLQGLFPYITKPGKHLYILFNGISNNNFKKLNMKKIKHYEALFPNYKGGYFPIQFSPSDNSIAYLFWHDCNDDIDGKIVELKWVSDTNNVQPKSVNIQPKVGCCENNGDWKLIKTRDDRLVDMKNRTYYGNDYRVAELIWRNYINPLTVDDLCMNIEDLSKEFYFQTSDSQEYKAIRKFNNMVKSEILNRFSNYNDKNTVIDLGCGKGQDLIKYVLISTIKNCIMIDNNENNLSEVVERKYSFMNNTAITGSLNVSVQCLDLLHGWEINYEKLKMKLSFVQKNDIKLVICNFAIHYFTKSTSSIDNFIEFVDQFMPSGSRFIFTCLDGKMIYDMLSNNQIKGEWGNGKKYLIRANYNNKIFKGGEEIELLLPFSNGTMYKEYLVNLDLLERRLKRKRIILETIDKFTVYLDKFKYKNIDLYTTLDKMDMEYLDLLKFCIYYKK